MLTSRVVGSTGRCPCLLPAYKRQPEHKATNNQWQIGQFCDHIASPRALPIYIPNLLLIDQQAVVICPY